MSQMMLYSLHSTLVLSFYIDGVLTLSIGIYSTVLFGLPNLKSDTILKHDCGSFVLISYDIIFEARLKHTWSLLYNIHSSGAFY